MKYPPIKLVYDHKGLVARVMVTVLSIAFFLAIMAIKPVRDEDFVTLVVLMKLFMVWMSSFGMSLSMYETMRFYLNEHIQHEQADVDLR